MIPRVSESVLIETCGMQFLFAVYVCRPFFVNYVALNSHEFILDIIYMKARRKL